MPKNSSFDFCTSSSATVMDSLLSKNRADFCFSRASCDAGVSSSSSAITASSVSSEKLSVAATGLSEVVGGGDGRVGVAVLGQLVSV